MKVNIIKKTENELKIEVEGAGHSLLNMLQKTLLEDDRIELAGYHVPHPLIDNGVLYIHTRGQQKSSDAINEATKRVLELSKNFQKSFQKAVKDWKKN